MLGAGILLMPIEVTRDYFLVLMGHMEQLTPPGIEDFLFWNQSVWAYWRKLFDDDQAVARLLGGACAAVILLVTLARQWNGRASRSAASDATSGLIAVLICAPVTWGHYLLAAIPAYVGSAESALRASAWFWRMLVPIGYLLTVLQRASPLLAPLMGPVIASSLTLFGMLAWWAATTFATSSSRAAGQRSGE